MSSQVKCRRCSECSNSEHHWMDNPEMDEGKPSHVCKHCPALGMECPVCCGDGFDPDSLNGECEKCTGHGVVDFGLYMKVRECSGAACRQILEQWSNWEEEAGREAQRYQLPEAGTFVMQGRVQAAIEKAIWMAR